MDNKNNLPLHPGEYIKINILDKNKITQKQLGEMIGVSRQTINQLVKQNIPLTEHLALRLNRLGAPFEFWLNLQNEYDRFFSDDGSAELSDKHKLLQNQWNAIGSRILVNQEIEQAVKISYIDILNFSTELLTPVGYKTRIGKRLVYQNNVVDLENGTFYIPQNGTVLIESLEYVKLPPNIMIRVYPTEALILDGVDVICDIHIYPNTSGHISAKLKASAEREVEIMMGDQFVCLEFYYLVVPPVPLKKFELKI
ncbi:HigA family addiction module antidote protein [bacterium]|nr:HigA family addiction module antidote protein [bacterium]